ncbi:MAG: hypothetical protein ACI9VR_000549 [Cognaticolwellia sp.]|jgi:hypothetical protein
MNNEFVDILALAPWLLCPTLVLLGLIFGAVKVLQGLGHVTSGFFAVPPDWAHWAETHKGYVERRAGRLSLRCTLSGQHFELDLPESGGHVRAQLTLDPPPLWVAGQLSDRISLGPDWIQLGKLRAVVTWDHACRVQLNMRVDQLMEEVEQLCTALGELQGRLDQDREALSLQHFTPQTKPAPRARAQALLVWTPSGAEPPPSPGKILGSWTRGSDALALSSRGWVLELAVLASTAFEIARTQQSTGGQRGGLGLSVVDMLLSTQGAPPASLRDPALAEDLLWLLHGHPGALNQQRLRVWLAPGELAEGLKRAENVRRTLTGPATAE